MKDRKTLGQFKCIKSSRSDTCDRYVLEGSIRGQIVSAFHNLPLEDKPLFIQSNPHGINIESYQIGDTAIKISEDNTRNYSLEIYHIKPEKREETLKKLIDAFK